MSALKRFWHLLHNNQFYTWGAHAAVTLLAGVVPTALWGIEPVTGAWVLMGYYWWREDRDMRKKLDAYTCPKCFRFSWADEGDIPPAAIRCTATDHCGGWAIRKGGNWLAPDDEGVTGRIDRVGDLGGPIIVAVTLLAVSLVG